MSPLWLWQCCLHARCNCPRTLTSLTAQLVQLPLKIRFPKPARSGNRQLRINAHHTYDLVFRFWTVDENVHGISAFMHREQARPGFLKASHFTFVPALAAAATTDVAIRTLTFCCRHKTHAFALPWVALPRANTCCSVGRCSTRFWAMSKAGSLALITAGSGYGLKLESWRTLSHLHKT